MSLQALSNLTSPTSSPAYSPAAYACILETMGRSVPPLVHSGASWVYQRASSILLRAYHSPDSDVYKIFMYRHSSIFARPPPAAGETTRSKPVPDARPPSSAVQACASPVCTRGHLRSVRHRTLQSDV